MPKTIKKGRRAVGTSSVGISDTRTLIKQVLNKLPNTWFLGDEEDIVIRLSGVHTDALVSVLNKFLNENRP